MNIKKTFYVMPLILGLIFISGFAIAATDTTAKNNKTNSQKEAKVAKDNSVNTNYTVEQQLCIKAAQDKRAVAVKSAQDTMNSATKSALKEKQDTVDAAQKVFDDTTKNALAVKQAAIDAAQKIKDAKQKATAIKAAQDAYSGNKTVEQAKISYKAAINEANNKYDANPKVKKAKPVYADAVKAANDQFQNDQKECLLAKITAKKGFLGTIGGAISGFFGKIMSIFK